METNSTQQEILLLIGTNFSSRHYSERDDKNHLTQKEQQDCRPKAI